MLEYIREMLLEKVNLDFAFDCFPELTEKAFQEWWYKAPSLDTLSHIILLTLLREDRPNAIC
jgi:hypothetical protein